MCLRVVTNKNPKSQGYGWKVFDARPGGLYSLTMDYTRLRPINQWIFSIAAKDSFLAKNEPGFHIYLSLKDAVAVSKLGFWKQPLGSVWKYATVRKVFYRNATIQGRGDGGFTPGNQCRVVVAQQIYIPAVGNEIYSL